MERNMDSTTMSNEKEDIIKIWSNYLDIAKENVIIEAADKILSSSSLKKATAIENMLININFRLRKKRSVEEIMKFIDIINNSHDDIVFFLYKIAVSGRILKYRTFNEQCLLMETLSEAYQENKLRVDYNIATNRPLLRNSDFEVQYQLIKEVNDCVSIEKLKCLKSIAESKKVSKYSLDQLLLIISKIDKTEDSQLGSIAKSVSKGNFDFFDAYKHAPRLLKRMLKRG